ncbi:MAG: hypothetical protein AVO39_10345 [delta proteobacterium MLS_D]|jgi:RimJ/RimL family protein N-acetyltransferase|nr:MAG: hypothetical protein AVO39_10345 [delta proteobacterium MLS_D]
MMQSVPCTLDHLIAIRDDAREKGITAVDAYRNYAARYLDEGPAIAVIETEDGRVLGCGGLRVQWQGMGEAWIVLSLAAIAKSTTEQFQHYRKAAYTIAGDFLRDVCGDMIRIQAHVRVDDAVAIQFAERLGFAREGLLKKFGMDGADHYIYAIVKGES